MCMQFVSSGKCRSNISVCYSNLSLGKATLCLRCSHSLSALNDTCNDRSVNAPILLSLQDKFFCINYTWQKYNSGSCLMICRNGCQWRLWRGSLRASEYKIKSEPEETRAHIKPKNLCRVRSSEKIWMKSIFQVAQQLSCAGCVLLRATVERLPSLDIDSPWCAGNAIPFLAWRGSRARARERC